MRDIQASIDKATEKVNYFKKERKGFWNWFNGYREYCNLRLSYWKEFLEYCYEEKKKEEAKPKARLGVQKKDTQS